MAQFAILNAAWAASIVLLEVPSGALADTIGRRNLLVSSGVLMVAEMLLLCFAPRGRPDLLFPIFLVNRVLSGAAEAAASGADEALAYDSLPEEGRAAAWAELLETQIRTQSMGYILAMSIGAAVYDPSLMQRLADLLGLDIRLSQAVTLRFPLYLTLAMAVLTLITTLRMTENRGGGGCDGTLERCGSSVAEALHLTLRAGAWILRTPFALCLILAGLCFDHVLRMVITLGSQYYRLISLPEASFGLIGSAMALQGLVVPRLARRLAHSHSPAVNFFLTAAVALAGLIGVSFFVPIAGLLPMALLTAVMYMVRFYQSHYLNRITSSEQRATVLSFKGLSFNLAYGLIGIGYSLLVAFMRSGAGTGDLPAAGAELDNAVFVKSISWFPWYFAAAVMLVTVFSRVQLRNTVEHRRPG
jgi:MFS family permease